MLTIAYRFINFILSCHGLEKLTPAQCAELAGYLEAGFPNTKPKAFKGLREVLHLRQILIPWFAERANAVIGLYRYQTNVASSPGDGPGNGQRDKKTETNQQPKDEGALQGKSRIFPRADQR